MTLDRLAITMEAYRPSKQCSFVSHEGINVCSECGYVDTSGFPPELVHAICGNSRVRIKRSAGLGDYVAKAIETLLPWTRKKKCEPCKQRQEKLNELGRRITG